MNRTRRLQAPATAPAEKESGSQPPKKIEEEKKVAAAKTKKPTKAKTKTNSKKVKKVKHSSITDDIQRLPLHLQTYVALLEQVEKAAAFLSKRHLPLTLQLVSATVHCTVDNLQILCQLLPEYLHLDKKKDPEADHFDDPHAPTYGHRSQRATSAATERKTANDKAVRAGPSLDAQVVLSFRLDFVPAPTPSNLKDSSMSAAATKKKPRITASPFTLKAAKLRKKALLKALKDICSEESQASAPKQLAPVTETSLPLPAASATKNPIQSTAAKSHGAATSGRETRTSTVEQRTATYPLPEPRNLAQVLREAESLQAKRESIASNGSGADRPVYLNLTGREIAPAELSARKTFDPKAMVDHLLRLPIGKGHAIRMHTVPKRHAKFQKPGAPLMDAMRQTLAAKGITSLFSHQAQALDAVRDGKHVMVSTATSSGKSLIYHIPTIEAILTSEELHGQGSPDCPTSIYMFPTKALAQDQLRALQEFIGSGWFGSCVTPRCLDSDTTRGERDEARQNGNILLTNPDMLHATLLPNHAQWCRFVTRDAEEDASCG